MSDNFQMCLELTEELEKYKKRINQYKQQLQAKEQECEELKNTVDYLRREFKKQKQINHAISRSCENLNCKDLQKLRAEKEELKERLQKYKDNEQQEKEMQKLYNKCNGNSLIEKRSPNEQF